MMKHIPYAAFPLPRRRFLALGGLAALAASGPTFAQNYPAKPIKLIVPFPPGGGADALARLMMVRIGKELGQPIVIENLAGAAGNIGTPTSTRPSAEGYTRI